MALPLAHPLKHLQRPSGEGFIHWHHVGIQQLQQGFHGVEHASTMGNNQQLLHGAGGEEQSRCILQLPLVVLPTGLRLQDGN